MRYLAWIVCVWSFQAQAKFYKWTYTRVVDGDTVEFTAPWVPLPEKLISVRIASIDTPEHGFRAKCESERNKAHQAKYFVENTLRTAKTVEVQTLAWDKYGGRILGIIWIDNKSLGQMLLDGGYARPYHGEKKQSWCETNEQ